LYFVKVFVGAENGTHLPPKNGTLDTSIESYFGTDQLATKSPGQATSIVGTLSLPLFFCTHTATGEEDFTSSIFFSSCPLVTILHNARDKIP
jgi:hypothetical protein